MGEPLRYTLSDDEMPTTWYNLIADLDSPPPPALHPGTLEPAGPDDFAPLFPMELIMQEVTTDRYVEIPGEVLDVYRLWRSTPLHRAHRLEKALGTPARIYYKYEGVSPAGSHKPNTAVPQAYYNAKAGVKKLTTETGAGQWGVALSFAAQAFGLDCEVWQVAASYHSKPYRSAIMRSFGATVHPSPSDQTDYGRSLLAADAENPGSLGIAISEAVSVAAQDPEIRYALDQGVTDYPEPAKVKPAKLVKAAAPKPDKPAVAEKKKPGRPKTKAAPPAPKPAAPKPLEPPEAKAAAAPTPDPMPAAPVPAPAPKAIPPKPKANSAAKPKTTRAKPAGAKGAAVRGATGRARTSAARAAKPTTTRRGRPPKKP